MTWDLLEQPPYRLHYAPVYANDARRIAVMMDQGYPLLLRRLAVRSLSATIDLFLHPAPTEAARAGTTRCNVTAAQAALAIRIDHLTPGAHDSGERYDDHYHFRVLMHELAAAVLTYRTRLKQQGWRGDESPAWFRAGYAGYLSLTCSDEHNQTITLEAYKDLLRADPDRVQATKDGITTLQPYVDGTVLLLYMHEHYGNYAGLRLLHSPEPTFWAAVDAEFGLTPEQLAEQVQMWLNSPFHEH